MADAPTNDGFEVRKLLLAARSGMLATAADGGQPFVSLSPRQRAGSFGLCCCCRTFPSIHGTFARTGAARSGLPGRRKARTRRPRRG